MITSDCSELGAPDFLIWDLFHFTWRKGGDGGEVTPVSTFSNTVPCLDCSFSSISDCSKVGAPDFLIWVLFHFTWRKGGDEREVTHVSTFSKHVLIDL